jgi:integrase
MARRETTFEVRLWNVRKVKGKRGLTYEVRWLVGRKERSRSFATAALAQSYRSELRTRLNRGEPFDVETGLPTSMLPGHGSITWWEWALIYVDLKWPHLAPRSRLSLAEAMTTVTVALTAKGKGRPRPERLRRLMMQWAFVVPRRTVGGPPKELQSALAWIEGNTLRLAELEDPAVVRAVLDALAVKLDGTRAAATTIARKRAVFHNALELAAEQRRIEANPLPRVRWRAPKQAEAIDPACVVNPDQARALLAAVGNLAGPDETDPKKLSFAARAKPLIAFFGCLYYAGLRPSEAVALEVAHLDLPEKDDEWGWLRLSANDPETTSAWTDGGKREARQLKHRARGTVRPVPCSPPLVALLRARLAEMGEGATGRLFRSAGGGPLRENFYTEVWQAARKKALTPAEAASLLARRPYDLRHSCVSTWLAAGVDSAQIAAWVGHSVDVLHRVYAHVLPGREQVARQRIDSLMAGAIESSSGRSMRRRS